MKKALKAIIIFLVMAAALINQGLCQNLPGGGTDPLTWSKAMADEPNETEEKTMAKNMTQVAKSGGDTYFVKDKTARSMISDEVTARESAIAAEAEARESAIAAEAEARESAIAAEAEARESAIEAEATARESAIAAEAEARESAIEAEATARESAIAAEASIREKNISDLKSALTYRDMLNKYGSCTFVSFNMGSYYSAANTKTANPNTGCAEIEIPSNLYCVELANIVSVGANLKTMFILDSGKNLLAEITGRKECRIQNYPTATYLQLNYYGSDVYGGFSFYGEKAVDELERITSELESKYTGEKKNITLNKGYYINSRGSKVEADGYAYTDPIYVAADETVAVMAYGYSNAIATISESDESGNNIVPKVLPQTGYALSTYKPMKNTYIIASGDLRNEILVIVSNAKVGNKLNIASNGNIIQDYWCNASGNIVEYAGLSMIKCPIPTDAQYISILNPEMCSSASLVTDLETGDVIFLNENDEKVRALSPQDYVVETPVDGKYYAAYPVPAGASKVCCSTKLATFNVEDSIVIVPNNKIPYTNDDCYELNGHNFCDNYARERIKVIEGRSTDEDWSDYTWLLVGDSLTQKNFRAETAYYDYISSRTGINLINKGSSGKGYDDLHWFYNALGQVSSNDFTFATFFGSGNDLYKHTSGGSTPYTDEEWSTVLGTADDREGNTICAWMNKTYDRFIELFPLKKFAVVTPTPWAETSNEDGTINGTHMDDYANKLVEICRNRGIPCLDLYHESGLRPWDENFRIEYYKEGGVQDNGTHPNSKGHKWISNMFYEFLKKYLIND